MLQQGISPMAYPAPVLVDGVAPAGMYMVAQPDVAGQYAVPMGAPAFDEEQVRRDISEEHKSKLKHLAKGAKEEALEVKEQREIDDSGTCIKATVLLNIVFSLLLLFPLFGDTWAERMFTATGIRDAKVSQSLFAITVKISCGTSAIAKWPGFCKMVKRTLNGKHSLYDAVGLMCEITPRACSEMNRIFAASFILLIGIPLTIFLSIFGSFMLYYHWNVNPRRKYRTHGIVAMTAAPFVGILSVITWAMLSPDLEVLPHSWMAATPIVGPLGTLIAGWRNIKMLPYGWCFYGTLGILSIMGVYVAIFPCIFIPSPHEEEAEELYYETREVMEDRLQMAQEGLPPPTYGAPTYGAVPMYGAPPNYGTAY